jgi:hypothetical protein
MTNHWRDFHQHLQSLAGEHSGKILVGCAIAIEVFLLVLWWLDFTTAGSLINFILVTFAAGLFYGLAVFTVFTVSSSLSSHMVPRALLWLIVVGGIVFRLSVIALPPVTSDDVYRYLWDGRVSAAGINPYRYQPQARELEFLRDTVVYPKINHPELRTIYPPLAQVCFGAAYRLAGNALWGIKGLLFLAECGTLWLLFKLFTGNLVSANPLWIVVYAWCPLPILECGMAAHVDGLGILFLVLFYLSIQHKRIPLAAVALAGAVLIKLVPVILLPWVWFHLPKPDRWWFGLIFGTLIIAGYAPFIEFSREVAVIQSLLVYLGTWSFNGPLYGLGKVLIGGPVSRTLCALGLIYWIWRVSTQVKHCPTAMSGLWFGFFLLTPTVYPWYLLWLAITLSWHWSTSGWWWLVSCPVSYLVLVTRLETGIWHESWLAYVVQYVPLILIGWRDWQSGVWKFSEK